MKLRLHNNSVRVRLNQGEVARLGEGQSVEQSTLFSPSTKLTYAIETSASATRMQVIFESNRVAIRVPAKQAKQWAGSDEVGIESQQAIDGEHSLRILIEKDFECLHPRAGENEDAFPNPRAS